MNHKFLDGSFSNHSQSGNFRDDISPSSAMNKKHRERLGVLGSNCFDQRDRNQNGFQNDVMPCDKIKRYDLLSGISRKKESHLLRPVENLGIRHPQMKDSGYHDDILGGAVLNASCQDSRHINPEVTGNCIGSVFEKPSFFLAEESRMPSTIKSDYSPLHKMGSVDEHEQFLANRGRASSLGNPGGHNMCFDLPKNHSYEDNVHDRLEEVSFGQRFREESEKIRGRRNMCSAQHLIKGSIAPINGLQGMPGQMQQHLNGPYNRCHLEERTTYGSEHHKTFNQDNNMHNTPDILLHDGALRQRVMSADGIYNRPRERNNSLGYGSNTSSRNSSNFDRVVYNEYQTNRPRSYSSGTNKNEYIRDRKVLTYTQNLVSEFGDNEKLSCMDANIAQLSTHGRPFYVDNVRYKSQMQLLEDDFDNERGAFDNNIQHSIEPQFLSSSIGPNDFVANSSRAPRCINDQCLQNGIPDLFKSQRSGKKTPIDIDTPFFRDLPTVQTKNTDSANLKKYNIMRHKHRHEVSTQQIGSIDHRCIDNLSRVGPTFVYNIKFKRSQRHFIIGKRMERDIKIGCYVKVEADRGEDLGIVIACIPLEKYDAGTVVNSQPTNVWGSKVEFDVSRPVGSSGLDVSPHPLPRGIGDLRKIVRLATHDEVSLLEIKKEEEEDLLKVCRGKIIQRGLPMNVVDAEYQFDRHKLTFFFEAEGRVDFRELVRDLFSIYKTRIWMQQLDKSATGVDEGHIPENTNNNISTSPNAYDILTTDCDSRGSD